MSVNTTPATVADGNPITGALWNAEVRDFAMVGLQAAWTAYTPTLGNITLGNGTLDAAYLRVGKTIHAARCTFSAGSTTTYAAGTLSFSLPVVPKTTYTSIGNYAVGTAVVQPGASTTRLPVTAIINTAGLLTFLSPAAANTIVTNLVPGTFGTSALITWTISYEAA
jgi:hypothetical protein